MDQSADVKKARVNAGTCSSEVIETSRAFLRPGAATGINSLRRLVLKG